MDVQYCSAVSMQNKHDLYYYQTDQDQSSVKRTKKSTASSNTSRRRSSSCKPKGKSKCDESVNSDEQTESSGKVRVLITPAPKDQQDEQQVDDFEARRKHHSLRSQQVVHPVATQNYQSQRSQSRTGAQYSAHYEDLNGSKYSTIDRFRRPATARNNYEHNILLFATEHSNSTSAPCGRGQQMSGIQSLALAVDAAAPATTDSKRLRNNSSNLANYYGRGSQPSITRVGKFVDLYPSWRQEKNSFSPTTEKLNYSFHVPLNSNYYCSNTAQRKNHFHPPVTRRLSAGRRSQTLGQLSSVGRANTEIGNITGGYEELYPVYSVALSEANLLKRSQQAKQEEPDGWDNPFLPGTQLSREADLMVELMKSGYQVSELPQLLKAAKEYETKEELKSAEQDLPSLNNTDSHLHPATAVDSNSFKIKQTHKSALTDANQKQENPSSETMELKATKQGKHHKQHKRPRRRNCCSVQ